MIISYNKYHTRQYDLNLPVHIFGTSSKGNSVYLSRLRVLIDLGLPYKRYSDINPNFFLDVDYIIITHNHSDHLNPSTLKKILNEYPHVKIIISQYLANKIMTTPRISKILTNEILNKYQKRFEQTMPEILTNRNNISFKFIPHYVPHGDLINIAIEIIDLSNNLHILYSSDIDTLNDLRFDKSTPDFMTGVPHDANNLFDIMFLEANYDKVLVDNALKIDPNDTKALGNLRHLSEQEAWNYVEQYLKDDGLFIPLHASSMYGTLIQKT